VVEHNRNAAAALRLRVVVVGVSVVSHGDTLQRMARAKKGEPDRGQGFGP
jgi:hypothetical protein